MFKEVAEDAGTGMGMAGGGGSGATDVMHKKNDGKKVRQRDGYDERLGVLLTNRVPVSAFIRAHESCGPCRRAESLAGRFRGHVHNSAGRRYLRVFGDLGQRLGRRPGQLFAIEALGNLLAGEAREGGVKEGGDLRGRIPPRGHARQSRIA